MSHFSFPLAKLASMGKFNGTEQCAITHMPVVNIQQTRRQTLAKRPDFIRIAATCHININIYIYYIHPIHRLGVMSESEGYCFELFPSTIIPSFKKPKTKHSPPPGKNNWYDRKRKRNSRPQMQHRMMKKKKRSPRT